MRALVHASSLFAPLVMVASLSSFAFGVSVEAIESTRALFVTLPLLALVMAFLGQRRPGFLVVAHAASLLAFGLAIYGAAALSGSGASLVERPSLAIALLASAWACATLGATSAEAMRDPEAR